MRRGGRPRGSSQRRGAANNNSNSGGRWLHDKYEDRSPVSEQWSSFRGRGINKRGAGRHLSNRQPNYRAKPMRPLGWQIRVINGENEDQMELMQSLQSKCGKTFTPENVSFTDNSVEFVISDDGAAGALERISGQLKNAKNRRIIIHKKPYYGDQTLSSEEEKRLTELLGALYSAKDRLLDISNFYDKQDGPGLVGQRFILGRKAVGSAICKIIASNIPELEKLDISNNRLHNMYTLSELPSKAPNIAVLNVSHNSMTHIAALDSVKSLKLIELNLDGNPLCDHYNDQVTYIKDIHKRFPSVTVVDGFPVKPEIAFDLDESGTAKKKILPRFLGSRSKDPGVMQVVHTFVQQYFQVYDTAERTNVLVDAYDTEAVFCMVFHFHGNHNKQPKVNSMFNKTLNLLKLSDEKYRDQMLVRGKFKVLAVLSDIPPTEHDLHSFKIDIIHETVTLVVFVINGLLREKEDSSLYAFQRTFCCKPHEGGLLVVNDSLQFRSPTEHERKVAFANPGPTPSNSPVQLIVQPPALSTLLTDQEKLVLVEKFSTESGLNKRGSAECLEMNSWDFAKAALDFKTAKERDTIPPEFFLPD